MAHPHAQEGACAALRSERARARDVPMARSAIPLGCLICAGLVCRVMLLSKSKASNALD